MTGVDFRNSAASLTAFPSVSSSLNLLPLAEGIECVDIHKNLYCSIKSSERSEAKLREAILKRSSSPPQAPPSQIIYTVPFQPLRRQDSSPALVMRIKAKISK
ncbi:hypothetical protein GALMADRAFT_878409 [Galerina marginata CBS 339.88]|uniref:Uncharacterized protein n=1 Tax=Galerina marginata (strain CBS 339.88) TaxID=685588 RepID=A0A067SSB2_GALM3|nr:hypothetical protein GALMADRAFT_878409 [Galerina marginata CBS 339.88]